MSTVFIDDEKTQDVHIYYKFDMLAIKKNIVWNSSTILLSFGRCILVDKIQWFDLKIFIYFKTSYIVDRLLVISIFNKLNMSIMVCLKGIYSV